jgi:hypothetical protein
MLLPVLRWMQKDKWNLLQPAHTFQITGSMSLTQMTLHSLEQTPPLLDMFPLEFQMVQ